MSEKENCCSTHPEGENKDKKGCCSSKGCCCLGKIVVKILLALLIFSAGYVVGSGKMCPMKVCPLSQPAK